MAAIRRLSDEDVRSVFEFLHGNGTLPPPPNLRFQVIPVGPRGLKLSPPSYEYLDGLYVLMKPDKKRKIQPHDSILSDTSNVPPHLEKFLIKELPAETCPWSLSGPQFPSPTAIQQRYCYPKGYPSYSSKKGGALWTMFGSDGKEDMEYRLLHVYFSSKRATNRGIRMPAEMIQEAVESSNSTVGTPSPSRRSVKSRYKTPTRRNPIARHGQGHHHPDSAISPMSALTASTVSHGSPAYRHQASSPVRTQYPPRPPTGRYGHYVSPSDTHAGYRLRPPEDRTLASFSFDEQDAGNDLFAHVRSATPGHASRLNGMHGHHHRRSDAHHHGEMGGLDDLTVSVSLQDFDDHDDWNDPFMKEAEPSPQIGASTNLDSVRLNGDVQELKNQLGKFQDELRRTIMLSPPRSQAPLVSAVSSWARDMSKNPLQELQKDTKPSPREDLEISGAAV